MNARAAYGAYVVQAPALVAIAVLLRETGLPLTVKFVVLVLTGVTVCFASAAALTRLPGVREIL